MKLKYVNFLNLSSQCGGQHKCPLASKYSSSCVCNYLYFSLLKPHNITDNNNNNIKNNDDNNYNYNNFNNNYNNKVKALFESSYSDVPCTSKNGDGYVLDHYAMMNTKIDSGAKELVAELVFLCNLYVTQARVRNFQTLYVEDCPKEKYSLIWRMIFVN